MVFVLLKPFSYQAAAKLLHFVIYWKLSLDFKKLYFPNQYIYMHIETLTLVHFSRDFYPIRSFTRVKWVCHSQLSLLNFFVYSCRNVNEKDCENCIFCKLLGVFFQVPRVELSSMQNTQRSSTQLMLYLAWWGQRWSSSP